jgi:hypothetical protein
MKLLLSGLESREYDRRDPSRWQRGTLYPQKFALTSPTSGGRYVGIVHWQSQATDLCMALMVNMDQFTYKVLISCL